MNLLVDTHVVLWWLSDPGVIKGVAREAIADPGNSVYVSAAAGWEIAVKRALGKLDAPPDLQDALGRADFRTLPITLAHALAVGELPPIHQDPFDRIQVAQGRLESMTLVTRDARIRAYDVVTMDA